MALTNAQHQKLWRDRRRVEFNLQAEPEAELIIGALEGMQQKIAIMRLVAVGAYRFVNEVCQQQRRERLKELRKPQKPPDRASMSAVGKRIYDARKAAGHVD